MIRFFDSHAHYDDQRFKNEFPGGTDGALDYSFENNVRAIVNSGSNLETSYNSILLSQKYANVFATVGIHPTDSQYIKKGELETSFLKIEEMAKTEKVVAIGEIGLDYHFDITYKEQQKLALIRQLQWAVALDLPVMIHARDATADIIDILRQFPSLRGVMHCFSGSNETAKQYIQMGLYLGIGGVITFKNSKLREHLTDIPLDRLVLETDAPYMTPVPFRGQPNESRYMIYVMQTLADVYQIPVSAIESTTNANAKALFGLK